METVKISRTLDEKLRFDLASEIERICAFIRREVQRRGVRGVVIGLSGGLDSATCAYLSARCRQLRFTCSVFQSVIAVPPYGITLIQQRAY
jgi:NH3-dependent NAD+ synthetase